MVAPDFVWLVLVPDDDVAALAPAPVQITTVGVPHRFLTDYGHQEQHDEAIGLTSSGVRARIEQLIHAK